MSTVPIVLKNSNQPSKVPSLNDLMYGEIAVNTYDGKIFIKINNGTEQIITFSASTDMSGYVPTSRTITAGTGLTGGGNLTANRTFNVSYGTTAGTAAQGNDSRINNGQTAFGWGNHAGAGYVLETRTITAGTGLTGGGNLTANRTFAVSYGTTAGTSAQGNDSRINNGQTAFSWGNHASAGYAIEDDVYSRNGAGGNITISTSNPSGGSNGDLWFKV